jgi:putative endonuclease
MPEKNAEGQTPENTAGLGKKGEDRAAEALISAGMNIIARNFRCKFGEIDIIALDGETLVFAEVKAWSAFGMENLPYSVNRRKQVRIIETAKYFLSIHRQYYGRAVRFDVVFVGKEAVTHLASAFMERV